MSYVACKDDNVEHAVPVLQIFVSSGAWHFRAMSAIAVTFSKIQ